MSIDPNTPVLLGAGQFTERLDDQFEGLMPEDRRRARVKLHWPILARLSR